MKISRKALAAMLVAPLLVGSFSTMATEQEAEAKEESKGASILIPYGMKYLFNDIELTNVQQGKVINITQTNSKAKKAVSKEDQQKFENEVLVKLDELTLKMQQVVLNETFDDAVVLDIAKQMAEVQAVRDIIKLREQHLLVNLLTAEQKEQVKKNILIHAEKNKKAKSDS